MINYENVKGLLIASKIDNEQDVAAFRVFASVVVNFQLMLGISDEKVAKFATIIADVINMHTDERKR